MSDTPISRRIRAQASPRDPLVMRFILDAPVQAGRTAGFDGPKDDAPLAQALFAITGVRKVRVMDATIMITRASDSDWDLLKAPVAAAIRASLDSTDQPLGAGEAPSGGRTDDELLVAVTDVLDRQANPAIARHGGHVTAERVENGDVYLRMSGGCQGCAASSKTLRNGIERIVRAALPEVREIVDVTDHTTGKTPFYRTGSGASPKFVVPVPDGSIDWNGGAPTVDPVYLSQRLGLSREQLHHAQARGDITTTTEPDRDSGRVRITVRGVQRSWAADILPDGTATEVPPSRSGATVAPPPDLPSRVRRHLEALSAHDVPITYGHLARQLGMYLPGSIRRVTAALETLMHEDAQAGRPFIAARAVGRGPAQLPGKGFFDLARALGHGPETDETERDFHRRQLADVSITV